MVIVTKFLRVTLNTVWQTEFMSGVVTSFCSNECCVIYNSVWTLSPPPSFFPSLRTNKQCVQSGTDVLLRSSPKILAGACCHQLYPEHLNRHADADVNLPQQQFHRWEGRYLPVHPKNGELGRSGREVVGGLGFHRIEGSSHIFLI